MKKLLLTIAFIGSFSFAQTFSFEKEVYKVSNESKLDNGNYFIVCELDGNNFIFITDERKEPLMYYSFEDMIWIEITAKTK